MKLYLFCDRDYGSPFLDVAVRRVRTRQLSLVVVLSERIAEANASRRPPQMARAWLKHARLRWRHGVEFVGADDVNAAHFLQRIEPGSHGVIAGFNQIFKVPAIDRFETFVNFHASLLPFYRGPAPSYWCLERGELWSGFTLHRVTSLVDRGELLYQDAVETTGAASVTDLDRRIAEKAVPCFERWLDHLDAGTPWRARLLDARALCTAPIEYLSFPSHERVGPTAAGARTK